MTDQTRILFKEALALPNRQRADLAAELLASLDEPAGDDPVAVEAAWAEELERRAARVLAGETPGQPWDVVKARVERRLRDR